MAAVLNEQKRNETTPKKSPKERLNVAQRQQKILKMRQKKKEMLKALDGDDEKAEEEFVEFRILSSTLGYYVNRLPVLSTVSGSPRT